MNDRHDELVRRAAELKAQSAALKMVSEELAGQVAARRQTGARAVERPGEQATADAGEARVPRPGAGILGEDEAVALAGLLEELAARHQHDPLRGPVLRAAALLRRRVAAGQQQSIGPRWGGPAVRREVSDTRDDAAGHRDAHAAERDRTATNRNDRARERDRLADAADERAGASEQRMRDRLWDAELRGQAAAERAAAPASDDGDAGWQQWQLGLEENGPDRGRDGEDREAMREILAQARAARQAARHDRYAAGQDRVASDRDRGSAQADRQAAGHDRQTARADRDQTVIESEEESPLTD